MYIRTQTKNKFYALAFISVFAWIAIELFFRSKSYKRRRRNRNASLSRRERIEDDLIVSNMVERESPNTENEIDGQNSDANFHSRRFLNYPDKDSTAYVYVKSSDENYEIKIASCYDSIRLHGRLDSISSYDNAIFKVENLKIELEKLEEHLRSEGKKFVDLKHQKESKPKNQ